MPISKKERPQEFINTSNFVKHISKKPFSSFLMVVYDVSSIVSKNRNVSDGNLLSIKDKRIIALLICYFDPFIKRK